jgi:hypothetical protein
MSRAIFSAPAGAAVALTAATAVVPLAWKAPGEHGLQWMGYELGFTGVVATEPPVLVELCYCTFAADGTATAATEVQECGRSVAIPGNAFYTYTVAPTVLTPFRRFSVTPVGGTVLYPFEDGFEPDCAADQGFAIRLTPGATITGSFQGSMRVARI